MEPKPITNEDWHRIAIDADRLDFERLLSPWRWLVVERLRPFLLSIFGDWFFEDDRGHIHFLDTIEGRLIEIAPSRAEFEAARNVLRNTDEWFMADLALLCFDRGLRPSTGQCLMFKIAPILGGLLEVENVEVAELMVHQSIMGQLHRSIQSAPPETPIHQILVDGKIA